MTLSFVFLLIPVPDDDLDNQRLDQEEATNLLQLLAHRGDGDWSCHYESGVAGLCQSIGPDFATKAMGNRT